MSDEDVNKNLPAAMSDGFDDFEDGMEGEEERQLDRRVIQGVRLSFANDFRWMFTDEKTEVPKNKEFILISLHRLVQKWVNKMPAENIWVEPGQKWPNINDKNKECPESEWSTDLNGNPQGPWQRQRIVYLVDPVTMEKFTWAVWTVGSDICIREIRDRIASMRKFHNNSHIYPIVTLGDRFMPTRFGGRQRPDLKIVRWIMGSGGGESLPVQPLKALSQIAVAEESASQTRVSLSKFAEVKPPTPKEEMGDSIPY